MTNVRNDLPDAEGYARALSAPSTIPITLSVNNASALSLDASSSIQRLPKELFIEIFLHYIAWNKHGNLDRRHGCWPLLSVCRYWHEIVTTTPTLWRDICIWFGASTNCRDPVAGLSLVLSRAGKMDLHIYFDGGPVQRNIVADISELALTLLGVLIKHSAQWRTVDLINIDAACMSALDGVSDRLPRLLKGAIQTQPEAGNTLALGYIPAPLLKSLSVLFYNSSESLVACCPLQSQLTEFKVRGAQYESSLVDVLRDCRDLKVLDLKFSLPSPRVDKRIFSQITEFTFQGFFSDLALVHLPQLRSLRIGDMDSESLDLVLPSLLDLIKHSRCPLKDLVLVNCDLAGLGAVLELVPLLRNLALTFGKFLPTSAAFVAGIDQVLSSLMTALGKVDLVPNLQRLLLILKVQKQDLSSELKFFKHEEVTAMLQRRSQMKACGGFIFERCRVMIKQEGWVDQLDHFP